MPHACMQSSCATQILVLLVMFTEALAILGRNQRHFRVTRALRPLLLLDTHVMAGARRCATTNNLTLIFILQYKIIFCLPFRIVRQIILCGKYIIDLLIILFFLIALAALSSGFSTYFSSITVTTNIEQILNVLQAIVYLLMLIQQ